MRGSREDLCRLVYWSHSIDRSFYFFLLVSRGVSNLALGWMLSPLMLSRNPHVAVRSEKPYSLLLLLSAVGSVS